MSDGRAHSASEARVGPYRVVRDLGGGAFSSAFLAEDPADGRQLVVKLARHGDANSRFAFRSEFRQGSRLHHPHLAEVLDHGLWGDRPYLVLAAHAGAPLADRDGPAPAELVAHVGAQLALALAELHAAGLIHRDVSPANVLLAASGHARLIDFGLLAPPGASPATGTPLTMAPEAIAGDPVGPAADLYGLGAVLYRLACGRAPFEGLAPAAILEAALRQAPPPLASAAPHLPPALAALIMRLLATDPADRPAEAAALARSLARFSRAPRLAPGPGRWAPGAAWSDWEALGGAPGVYAFVGEPGLGVSRHLREAFLRLRRQDRPALRIEARQIDAPYALLARLWRAAAARAGSPALPPAQRRLVASLWPWAFPDEPRLAEAAALKSALLAGLADMLGRLGQGPAVLIDRFEAVDAASLALLEQGWQGALGGCHWLLGSREPVRAATSLPIAPLSREAAAAWLDSARGEPLEPGIADRLYEAFGGNPGFLAQALAHGPAAETLPGSVAQVMAARWDRLAPPARAMAEAMAVLGEPLGPELPGPLASVWPEEAPTALDGLHEAGIVTTEGGACRFREGAWGPFLLAHMAPGRRRALAAAIASAIAPPEGPACRDASLLHRLAELHAMAEAGEATVAYGLAAGLASARIHANAQALAHFAAARQAIAASRDPGAHRETALAIAVAEADVRRVTGELAAAASAYEAAMALAPSAVRGRLLVSLGKTRQMLNQPAQAAEALAEALALLPVEAVDERLRALCTLGRVLHHQGERAASLARYGEALDLARAHGADAPLAEALAFLGAAAAGEAGRAEEGLGMLREALAIREARGEALALADAHMLLGNALFGLGRMSEAISHFEANMDTAAAAGSRQEAAFARLNLALCETERGRPHAALGQLQAGSALAEAVGDDLLLGLSGFLEALARLYAGEIGAALPALAAARDREARLASPYLRVYGLLAEAERHLFLGGFEAARRASEMAIALIDRGAGPECEGKARLLLAEAWLHQGQGEAAEAAICRAEGPAADRLRGLLAIARGDQAAGAALLEAASEAARQRGLVRLEARSRLALAEAASGAAALEEAYALAETEQLPDLLACSLLGLARRRLEAGDELVAERLQRRGEALIEHLTAQLPGASARQAFLAHPERAPYLAVPGPSEASRLARQGRRLQMLLELGAALGRVREPERVLALVHDFTREVTRAERCLVLLGAEPQGLALARGEGGYSRTIVQQVLATRKPMCVLDTEDDQTLSASASVLALRLRAVMCVPLVVEEALLGVIYVDSQVALGAFTDDDMRVLTAIANQAAVALDGARLHAALKAQLERQEDYIRRLEESAHVIRHLEELDRVRAEYFQAASHDLRGPLNSINASCQALLKGLFGTLATEQQETVEGIHHGSRTLVALIDSLLDAARLEAGKLYMSPQPVALARPVGEAVRLLSALAEEKGLALRFEPAAMAALPPVRGDERRLMQIVLNLLGNAIKFTAQGHVRLTATAGAGVVALVVADTGPGLPPDRLASPFERYGSTSAAAPGSGLGLWLVKGLVELHEGTIAVESRPGEGCIFTVRLPVA